MTDAAADPRAGRVSGLAVPGSGALLVGSGRHDPGSGLPDVPAVGRTLRDVADVLSDRCGLAATGITVIEDPPDPGALGVAIARRAAEVTGVLYLHYVGHGLIGPGGDLHLATAASRRDVGLLAFTSLPWPALREALRESPAEAIVVVLDCCFSGRATGSLGDRPRVGLDVAQARGTYVLTSSAAAEVSLARPGAAHTAFSGELIRLLTEGDERLPDRLTLSAVFDHLDRELPRQGLPAPRRFSTGRADRLVLAANAARLRPARPAEDDVPDAGSPAACPYLGLQPFRVGDAPLFHGRERLTRDLVDRLGDRFPAGGPLVVVGASGSGKSSLLNAGLLPALGRGELPVPGSATWPVLVVVPGADPVAALAKAVRELAPDVDPAAAGREIRADPAGLARLLRRARPPKGPDPLPVVLVVDQFEDVFAGPDEPAARAFVDAVCTAAEALDGSPPAVVVLGLRADFYGQAVAHPALREALARDPLLVGPMTSGELRSAIEEPARIAGLTLEPGLPELLLADLGVRGDDAAYDAGRLPLLSHAMFATWRRRSGRTLTVAGYRAVGRVDGAVAETAERVFEGLAPEEQEDARRILLRLVMVGDGTPDTRARIPRQVIDPYAWQVLRVLAAEDARLVTLDRDTVELSHDSLLYAWTRLRRWIAEDRAGRLIHQRAAQAAQVWVAGGQRDADLSTGTRLSAFQEWAAEHPDELAEPEQAFLVASVRAAERTERLRRRFTRGLAALLVVSLAATGIAVWQWRTAAGRERVATARSLAAQAASLRDPAPDRAIALALAAYRTDPSPQSRAALADELTSSHLVGLGPGVVGASVVAFHPLRPVLATGGDSDPDLPLSSLADNDWGRELSEPSAELSGVYGVVFSPDGGLLAAEGRNGLPREDGLVAEPFTLATVRVWDTRDVRRPRLLAELPGSGRPAFSNGRTLVTVTGRRAVVWDLATPSRPRRVAAVGDDVATVAVAPNGRLLATISPGGDIRLWDLAVPTRRLGVLEGTHVAFDPRGDRAAVVSPNGRLELWDLTDPGRPTRVGEPSAPRLDSAALAAFGPDGTSLAAVGTDRRITVWRLARGTAAQVLANFGTGHAQPVTALAFGPDASTLATAADDPLPHDRARVWRVRPAADAAVIARAPALTAVSAIAVTRDGTLVAHGQDAGRVKLRRPAAGLAAAAELVTSVRRAESSAFSPDGRLLAVGGATGSDDDERSRVELWDVADPGRPTRLGILVPPGEGVPDLEFAPNGATLAVISELRRAAENHQDVTLWDTAAPASARRLATFDVHLNTGSQTAGGMVRFSPDGRLLGTVSGERDAAVWSLTDRTRPRRLAELEHDEWFQGWPSRAAALAFAPDGHHLATADGGSVVLWDLRDPSRPRRAGVLAVRNTNHDPAPIALAFAGGADLLAVAFPNGVVRLLATGTPEQPAGLAQLVDRGPIVTGSGVPAIDGAGHRLVAGGPTEVVVRDISALRQLTTRPLPDWACAAVGSAFDKRQWEAELAPNLPYERTCPHRP